VSVRRRLGDDLAGDHAARAGTVVDDDVLSPHFPQALREYARNDVGVAAGGEADDDPDRFGRKILAAALPMANAMTARLSAKLRRVCMFLLFCSLHNVIRTHALSTTWKPRRCDLCRPAA
jgi:hypothetical protein